MKSITVHGLDDALDTKIRAEAGKKGQSLNKTIKQLLGDALGVGEKPHDRRQDFRDLFDTWSSADLDAFSRATERFGKVDPEDWK
jgi:plasmid stability protein